MSDQFNYLPDEILNFTNQIANRAGGEPMSPIRTPRARNRSITPVFHRNRSLSPGPRRRPGFRRNRSRTPRRGRSLDPPRRGRSRSPRRGHSLDPLRRGRSRSPIRRLSPNPPRRQSPNPPRRQSPNPPRRNPPRRARRRQSPNPPRRQSPRRQNPRRRSPSPFRNVQGQIRHPYLRRISNKELRYAENPHSLTLKMNTGRGFRQTRIPNKVCRYLTSHCTKRFPTNKDRTPRHTIIEITPRNIPR